jgi:DNA-binding MarR family transcriptional regulator
LCPEIEIYDNVSNDIEEQIRNLPPSAKLVYKVLEYEPEMTQSQLVDETRLSARTVRYALDELQSVDVIDQEIYFADARQRLYSLNATIQATDSSK